MAHTVQYLCLGLLKPEFYGVGPPKLLGSIHVGITF